MKASHYRYVGAGGGQIPEVEGRLWLLWQIRGGKLNPEIRSHWR